MAYDREKAGRVKAGNDKKCFVTFDSAVGGLI
jgi:hypothetical protein